MDSATSNAAPPLARDDFDFFRALIHELCGIHLAEKKHDLVAARLRAHVAKAGFASYAAYRDSLARAPAGSPELQAFINLMTTNKTEFFRERAHFEYLAAEVLPRLSRPVSVWCGACSTGEEAYTLAMVLRRHLPPGVPFAVLATDVDTRALAHARNGVYPAGRAAEIPGEYQDGAIVRGKGAARGWLKIADAVHGAVTFARHNLHADGALPGEPFDLVFCRNVMIYFDAATVTSLAGKLHRRLAADGHLCIGHTEALHGAKALFQAVKPSILRKR